MCFNGFAHKVSRHRTPRHEERASSFSRLKGDVAMLFTSTSWEARGEDWDGLDEVDALPRLLPTTPRGDCC